MPELQDLGFGQAYPRRGRRVTDMFWYSEPWTLRYWLWLAAAFALSAAVAWAALHYALRHALLDLPGRRRSHAAPTPRGAGIGIVVAALASIFALAHAVPAAAPELRLCIPIALVAAIGWIDDHRPLPVLLRLGVHCLAVAIFLQPLLAAMFHLTASAPWLDTTFWQSAGIVALLGFVCIWSINLHNFMDGIDGLLALQTIFVLVAMAVLCQRYGNNPHDMQIALWAAAVAGFLPFNFPRARAFMGDVGSGSVGFLIAIAVIWQNSSPYSAALSGIVAASAFVTDASGTLLSRMLCGRRWYRAHREHLYQWMARAGMSHARVVAGYMAWNLLVVVPVLYWMNLRPFGAPPKPGAVATLGIYALAIIVWICGKRWCLYKVKSKKRYGLA
ncbi:MAG: glycosyltransferase family 4 protein [Xanthomonadaceae bacterium]|nr:glycosyltransferase family 4 protein [Xanthomonadaceae bacterium]